MESRGPEDSKNVKTSQAYFFEGFISFFEDFSLTSKEVAVGERISYWIRTPQVPGSRPGWYGTFY